MTQVAATTSAPADDQRRRLSIGFVNWAHGIDHYVMLVFPMVVLSLEGVYGLSYGELLAVGTASFYAFGIFSLPAGWLADRWSRRNMMALFYLGCGASLFAAGLAPNLVVLAIALFALGMFAAIYHPVGTAMVVEAAVSRGRTLAFNGVCGNLGVALAPGISAALIATLGWKAAFFLPAAVCIATGIVYLVMMPDDRHRTAGRSVTPDVSLAFWMAAAIFGLFIIVALSAGLVFNTMTVALPKIVDERLGFNLSLTAVGGLTTAVFLCGAIAQIAVGRLVERYPPHLIFAAVAALQFAGVVWVAYASGSLLLVALAVAMAAIYGQVTVTDLVIARYTADAWRARVYSVRYFITYLISGVAVTMIAALYTRGGFDLVLGTTAVLALGFVVAVMGIAILVNGVERDRRHAVAPAE